MLFPTFDWIVFEESKSSRKRIPYNSRLAGLALFQYNSSALFTMKGLLCKSLIALLLGRHTTPAVE